MSDQEFTATREVERIKAGHRLPSDPPTINILLYTDDPNGIRPGNDTSDLATMIEHLYAHQPAFARFEVTWLSRNSKCDNKLNPEMLKLYDEIWFFGIHQLNNEPDAPESELTEPEVRALTDWMKFNEMKKLKGGGVLMTGDHAEPRPGGTPGQNPSCPDSSKADLLGLGRALGRCVPRAGLLRKWEGSPTSNPPAERFNTQTPVSGHDPGGGELQTDAFPMLLILSRFDAGGNPGSTGAAHPLFFYPQGKFIQVFPDHVHEGAVIIPESFDENVWPKGKFLWPKPQVVARGFDYPNGTAGNILAAYDGDPAGVGRVVADSTWHHYMNENLQRFRPGTPVGSDADQIGQFYGNLALWLAPFNKRRDMARLMFAWLASRLSVREEFMGHADAPSYEQVAGIGRAAYSALLSVASPCEVHELLTASLPPEYREHFERVYLPETGVSLSLFPSKEEALGFIIDSYWRAIINSTDVDDDESISRIEASIWDGFRLAFRSHVNRLEQFALEVSRIHNLGFNDGKEKRNG
jgi:hypothetical protein